MSRVLVLSSYYLGTATANGLCARNIVNQLKSNGHEVFVLCYDGVPAEKGVYTIDCPNSNKRRTIFSKIKSRICSLFVPRIDKILSGEYRCLAVKLCKELKIDVVVCFFFPLETITVLPEIKKCNSQVKTLVYELDSVGDGIFSASKYQLLTNKAIERWCNKQYNYADQIIVMQSHEEYWNKAFGKKHSEKVRFADIPVLTPKQLPQHVKDLSAPVSLLYAGLIEQAYRSPDYLLALFEEYQKTEEATLDFFSKGDCEAKIAEIAKRVSGIRQNGYVPVAALEEAIAKADVLVSIGNRFSRSVPSKLITYISYGKPIIHFASQNNDVCVDYLKKYPLALILYESDSLENNLRKLKEFLGFTVGKTVDAQQIKKAFVENTAEYSAELIESVFN